MKLSRSQPNIEVDDDDEQQICIKDESVISLLHHHEVTKVTIEPEIIEFLYEETGKPL